MKNFYLIFMMLFSSIAFAGNTDAIEVGSGDILELFVEGSPDLSRQTQVALDGSINIPLLGKVKVEGETTSEIERKLQTMLRDGGFLKKPKVDITLLNSVRNQVTILGKIPAPGKYPINPSTVSIFDLLALSGGVDPMSKVLIVRNSGGLFSRIEVDIEDVLVNGTDEDLSNFDLKLKKNDIVYVKESPVFYTYGETGNKMLPLKDDLTLQQAIVMAGGFSQIADKDDVKIKRKVSKGSYKEIEANLNTIIQEDDVIIVEESLF